MARLISILCLVLIIVLRISNLAEAKVKCHECTDWGDVLCRHTQTCEDEFCFKSNSSVKDHGFNKIHNLRVGCVSTGPIGCGDDRLQIPGMADVVTTSCRCATDYCNEIPKSTSAARSFRFRAALLLWPGVMSFTFPVIPIFCVFIGFFDLL